MGLGNGVKVGKALKLDEVDGSRKAQRSVFLDKAAFWTSILFNGV